MVQLEAEYARHVLGRQLAVGRRAQLGIDHEEEVRERGAEKGAIDVCVGAEGKVCGKLARRQRKIGRKIKEKK